MFLSLVQLFFLTVVPWTFWHLIRRRIFPTTLDNIPGPKPASWLTGSLNEMTKFNAWGYHQKIADTYGGVSRIKGVFGANNLYIFDPKALYHILLKDQNVYEETDAFIELNKIVFGDGIFTSLGEKHRRQRKMLNPVFSISHLREMVPIFYEVAHKVERAFLQKVQNGPQEIDVLDWMARLALELIGQSGLGYTFDELTETAIPHRYSLAAKQLTTAREGSAFIDVTILPILTRIGTPRFRRFIVDLIPFKSFRDSRDIIDTLHATSVEIFDSKKNALQQGDEVLAAQIGRGKDIISILMKANMQASEEERLSETELLGQITSLTFAATDTTSGALTRTLHLLAQNKDSQEKVRDEIRNARKENGGQDINYDVLVSLPYLDAICRETLRLHPPVPTLMRTACQDIVLPLATPIKGINGELVHEIPLQNGTDIHISIHNSNRNLELWGPDANEWKPERWLNPLPDALINARIPGIYSHILTFLGGSRSCIGFKFSQLEMKVVLALLLESFEFSLSDKKIFWQMSSIVSPTVELGTMASLPMIISSAK